MDAERTQEIAVTFFTELAEQAARSGVVIALEPNPPIYQTNFINTTAEAAAFCKAVGHPCLKINVDAGTMVYNDESAACITEYGGMVNHVHLSEPNLASITSRVLHRALAHVIAPMPVYISLEMKDPRNIETVKQCLYYLKEVFS